MLSSRYDLLIDRPGDDSERLLAWIERRLGFGLPRHEAAEVGTVGFSVFGAEGVVLPADELSAELRKLSTFTTHSCRLIVPPAFDDSEMTEAVSLLVQVFARKSRVIVVHNEQWILCDAPKGARRLRFAHHSQPTK